jgi:hypothetical protein
MFKIPAEYNRDTSLKNLTDISRQVSPALLLDISADIFQRALADEPGMIRTQMGTHDRSENCCGAWDALYDTTRNRDQ